MPPFAFVDYKGLQVGDVSPSGVGGAAIDGNMREIADRVGPVANVAGAPTVNSDSDNTDTNGSFQQFSKWRDTGNNDLYMCADATPTAAVWFLISAGGSFDFVVDEQGTGQFTDIQAAIDAAELRGVPASILVVNGDYTGFNLVGDRIAITGIGGQFQGAKITGNVTITANATKAYSLAYLAIDGTLTLAGTGQMLIDIDHVEINQSGGTSPLVLTNTNGGSTLVYTDFFCIESGDTAPAVLRSAGSFNLDGHNGEFSRNGASNSALVAIDYTAGGTGVAILRNTKVLGQIDLSGSSVSMTFSGAAGQVVTAGTTPCFKLTAFGNAVFVFGTNLALIGGGDVVTPKLPAQFFYSNVIAGFGTLLDETMGTRITVDGVDLQAAGSVLEFLNATGGYSVPSAETLAGTLAAGNTSGGNDLVMSSGDNINVDKVRGNGTNLILDLRGGQGGTVGGNVSIQGGFGTTTPGQINITGGTTNAIGANVFIAGGDGPTGLSGSVLISGGTSGDDNGIGGQVQLLGGQGGVVTGAGGDVVIKSGDSQGSGQAPGTITIDAGERIGFSVFGDVLLQPINGQVGVGVTSIVASALLEMGSTTKGFLPPRMTTTQRDAIPSPATGLEIYNTTAGAPEFFDSSVWVGYEASIDSVYVRSLGDLPTPVANVITLADNTVYKFLNSVDTAGDQIKTGLSTVLIGIDDTATVLSGTTTVPLIITNGVNGFDSRSISFTQNGSGDLFSISMTAIAAVTTLTNCTLVGGVVRLVTGFGFITTRTLFSGAQIIQDGAGGGIDSINLSGLTAILDGGVAIDGLILFESGSSTDSFIMSGDAIVLTAASVGIRVEGTATITAFVASSDVVQVLDAGATGVIVEDPDAIAVGTLSDSNLVVVGKAIACEPLSLSNFSSPDADPRDVGFDGVNLLSCDPSTAVNASVYKHTGVGSSLDTTLVSAVFTDVRSVAWARGNLLSILDDGDPGTIQIHDGFSVTVDTTFASPGNTPVGITYDGTNIITLDATTGTVSVHDGETVDVLESFASPAGTDSSGITFDGTNLLISDDANNLIYVMQGISATVQYSFTGPGTLANGIVVTDVGAVVSDVTATATMHIYSHRVTFDHTSPTWVLENNSGGPVGSSDRGGSQFTNGTAGIAVAIGTTDVFVDIAATDIFYGSFNAMEKCRLSDELNGELTWLGVRDRGRVITGIATITRGAGGGDIFYEMAILINDVVQKDSIASIVLPSANAYGTLPTAPITKCLVAGDTVKLQIRNTTDTTDALVVSAKLSVN